MQMQPYCIAAAAACPSSKLGNLFNIGTKTPLYSSFFHLKRLRLFLFARSFNGWKGRGQKLCQTYLSFRKGDFPTDSCRTESNTKAVLTIPALQLCLLSGISKYSILPKSAILERLHLMKLVESKVFCSVDVVLALLKPSFDVCYAVQVPMHRSEHRRSISRTEPVSVLSESCKDWL